MSKPSLKDVLNKHKDKEKTNAPPIKHIVINSRDAKTLFFDLPKKHKFWLKGGGEINNLTELFRSLVEMDDDVFNHHVNNRGDDFAKWVDRVLGDPVLSRRLKGSRTRVEHTEIVRDRIEDLKRGSFPLDRSFAPLRPDYSFIEVEKERKIRAPPKKSSIEHHFRIHPHPLDPDTTFIDSSSKRKVEDRNYGRIVATQRDMVAALEQSVREKQRIENDFDNLQGEYNQLTGQLSAMRNEFSGLKVELKKRRQEQTKTDKNRLNQVKTTIDQLRTRETEILKEIKTVSKKEEQLMEKKKSILGREQEISSKENFLLKKEGHYNQLLQKYNEMLESLKDRMASDEDKIDGLMTDFGNSKTEDEKVADIIDKKPNNNSTLQIPTPTVHETPHSKKSHEQHRHYKIHHHEKPHHEAHHHEKSHHETHHHEQKKAMHKEHEAVQPTKKQGLSSDNLSYSNDANEIHAKHKFSKPQIKFIQEYDFSEINNNPLKSKTSNQTSNDIENPTVIDMQNPEPIKNMLGKTLFGKNTTKEEIEKLLNEAKELKESDKPSQVHENLEHIKKLLHDSKLDPDYKKTVYYQVFEMATDLDLEK